MKTVYICDIGGSYLAPALPGQPLVWANTGREDAATLPASTAVRLRRANAAHLFRTEAVALMIGAVRFIRAYYAGQGRDCPKLVCTIRPAKGGSPISWDMPKEAA